MSRKVTIALDAMGGDHGPDSVVPAALAVLEKDDSASLVLVGLPAVLEQAKRAANDRYGSRLGFRPASEVVAMDEPPADALRKKKDSSLRVAIELVKNAEADACVSSGNTGALMATARYVLKTLPGIDRPAIISAVPSLKGRTYMLDLGANVGCTSQQLLQFALMGSVVAGDMLEVARPRVGLLNIGQEDIKGNDIVREAGELLAQSGLNYTGFVEGDGIFLADVDVVVSDGFVGNVALKTTEGVAGLISSYLKEEFRRNPIRKAQGLIARSALESLRNRLDPRRYNGASLVGLNGVVLKSHGSADKFAFETAVQTAIVEARKGVPVQIGQLIDTQPKECIHA
ncbi:MAG TPA: phosphate acyltransferase PlsX [Gammaproteobacteria bacterium]|nr:phosphate acyltransferase PlsX [Gammaproteobacteria bacterium]